MENKTKSSKTNTTSGNASYTEKVPDIIQPKAQDSRNGIIRDTNSSQCLPEQHDIHRLSNDDQNCTVDTNQKCRTDEVCLFYGDCCSSYRQVKYGFSEVERLSLLVSETRSYSRIVHVYEQYRWFKLMTCELGLTTHMVTQCSEDDDVIVKANDVINMLSQPSENGSLYFGLSLPDVTSRCHGVTSPTYLSINNVPVTMTKGSTFVDFRNVFCAMCNGLNPGTVKPWETVIHCHHNLSKNTIEQAVLESNKSVVDSCVLQLITPNHTRQCPEHQPYSINPELGSLLEVAPQSDLILKVPNFRQLFDFNVFTSTPQVNEMCGENQIFAPLYQKCLEITCPEGTHLIGRECVSTKYDQNTSDFMETYNMTLPTQPREINVYIWFKYLLEDHCKYNDEWCCFSQAYNNTILESRVQQLLRKKISQPDKRLTLSLHYFTCVWTMAMMESGAINRTEATSSLIDELNANFKNSSSAQCSVLQVNSSLCSNIPLKGNDTNINKTGICVLINFNFSSSSESDVVISDIKTKILTSLYDIAHQNNFLIHNVTLTNQDGELTTADKTVCFSGRKLVFKEMPLLTHENGTSLVDFNFTTLPMRDFIFYLHYSGEIISRDRHANKATIGWCDGPILKCPFVFVNKSNIVYFHNYLLITKNSETIKSYLQSYSNTSTSINTLKTMLHEKFHGKIISIYKQQDYVITEDGANVCFDELKLPQTLMPTTEAERAATLIACGISVSCLVIVLVVYGLVPELRNVPGKIVMSMSSALLAAQTMFLCCSYPRGLACEIYAAVHHAVWLASFTWLAAMALHLACILHLQSQRWFNPSRSAIFYVFSALCWGLPSLIAGSCFILDQNGIVQINYGKNGICWIGNVKSILAVFIVPIFLLLSITAVCAVFVIKAIRKSSNFRQKNSQHKREKTQLVLCVNLSLMMGLTWVFYFLALAVNTSYMWIVFILTNGCQGLYVFLCYLARKSVMVKLGGLLGRFKPQPPNITDAIDLTRSTTLWTLPSTDKVPRLSARTYVYTVNP